MFMIFITNSFRLIAFSCDCKLAMIWLLLSIKSLSLSSDDDILISSTDVKMDTKLVIISMVAIAAPIMTCRTFLTKDLSIECLLICSVL